MRGAGNKIKIFLLAAFLTVADLSATVAPHIAGAAETPIFDRTEIEEDLNGLDLTTYPKNENASATVLTFSEFGYSANSFKAQDYGLYFFVYNPGERAVSARSGANSVNMAIEYEAGEPTEYANLKLTLVDETGDHRFLKFRLTNGAGAYERARAYAGANEGVRRYDVAGLQLWYGGDGSATDCPIEATYRCEGFAKGYGADAGAESTLSVTVDKLETVTLDVRSTYFRTGMNANGEGHSNQLTSVYFAIPKDKIASYGNLYAVKCEWDERRTAPVIVTTDEAIYDDVLDHLGTDGTGGAYQIYDGYSSSMASAASATWAYNGGDVVVPVNNPGVGYVFKSTDQSVLSTSISSSDMLKWIADHGYAEYLFTDDVDEGRMYGKQEHTVYADEPFDMLSFNSTSDGWEQFCQSWREFWSGRAYDWGEDYKNVEPIKYVTEEDFQGDTDGENAKALFVNANDYGVFKSFYDANKTENDVFLLRFAVTDYYSNLQTVYKSDAFIQTADKTSTYMARETVFLGFDVIDLTFKLEGGKETVLAVVADPVDIVAGIDPPQIVNYDWIWSIIVVILALIVLLIVVKLTKRRKKE